MGHKKISCTIPFMSIHLHRSSVSCSGTCKLPPRLPNQSSLQRRPVGLFWSHRAPWSAAMPNTEASSPVLSSGANSSLPNWLKCCPESSEHRKSLQNISFGFWPVRHCWLDLCEWETHRLVCHMYSRSQPPVQGNDSLTHRDPQGGL